jgi:hypothetical protein
MMALASPLRREQCQAQGTLLSMLEHEMNLFLKKVGVFANGSESKIWSDGTSQSTRRRRRRRRRRRTAMSTRCIIVHAETQNGFVSGESLTLVSGAKLGDYHDSMNGEHCMY